MIADHVISMPDKWECPWFAAWDLAFHALALSSLDIDFAKQQINLLLDLSESDRTASRLRVELQRCQSAGRAGANPEWRGASARLKVRFAGLSMEASPCAGQRPALLDH
jgi:hypothetical protein